ncbi:aminodeoxychorismate synthase component I [Alicyclobacillus fastidiosus]|uniref:Aminodeoxychorismate synthase component I n=1 Tax=Alicyclobacillus fastidiosus TaxID=392011 RepID=A0ABV5A9R0_9BACL|nr:aminodeoxychorismate synthase component I [Alicyclobacillus fastidiosus]WEH10868.1 aminodeoxychorismate synthase component I [Alicyclobacillus fastidiosus]
MTQHKNNSPILLFDFEHLRSTDGMVFTNPTQVIEAHRVDEVRQALQKVDELVQAGFYAAGFVAYEAAPAFDPALQVHTTSHCPLLWFGIFKQPASPRPKPHGDYRLGDWTPSIGEQTYKNDIHSIRSAIERGETYQVNYTMRLHTPFHGDSLALYESLRATQQAPFAAYVNTGDNQFVSMSPELFFQVEHGKITTRPMKGTIPRGRWLEEDHVQRDRLRSSVKDQAENVMIVDLLRNDLSRIARPGSVRVKQLFDIEQYPTVFQLTSTIEADVQGHSSLDSIFTALFPCGSITGAPKVSTMDLISQLEREPRGVYCGTIGYIEPNGRATFNVAIRTIQVREANGTAMYGTGGGITWDSTADGEYREAWTKAQALTTGWRPFKLLETIRCEHGQYHLLDRHISRLRASAQYFSFPCDESQIVKDLRHHAKALPHSSSHRVRLLVSRKGDIHVESSPISEAVGTSQPVVLARNPIDSSNPFLYHKTTHRDVYDVHRKMFPRVFDVLLWNERGELTEFTIGNLVLEIGTEKWTPARESGLLAGTFRDELIESGMLRERRLALDDLRQADQVWLINSVRGWVKVHLVDAKSAQ